jgi:hypothetical protein
LRLRGRARRSSTGGASGLALEVQFTESAPHLIFSCRCDVLPTGRAATKVSGCYRVSTDDLPRSYQQNVSIVMQGSVSVLGEVTMNNACYAAVR